MSRALCLAVELDGDGAHPEAWRQAAHAPDHLLTPARVRRVATIAENAGFALATLDDDLLPPSGVPGRIGAVERAAFVAASTSTLGVAPVVSTTYAEPFHVSSQLASLDHISVGRAGWVVGTSPTPAAARAWGRPHVATAGAVRREAVDSVRVARALWDSWEDDAVLRDVSTSRYLDRDRLHYVDFAGDTFTVKGPAIVPRPPQGQLVVFAAAGLLPAHDVDVTLVGGTDVDAVLAAAANAGTPRVFADVEVALDTEDATAADRVARLDAHTPWPDRGRLRHVGSAAGLVALLTDLAGAVDGVRLHPLVLDDDLTVLSRLVTPALLRAGVTTRPIPGRSLRDALGLARPVNRFVTTGAEGAAR